MRILLTNDDSHRSPLLAFIIKYLKNIAELTIVVPKHEQSWKGKSMTRFGYLHLEEMELFGEKAYTIDGTPADCTNIAIYHLFADKKPDLVVSGINAGLNAGLGFIWSSGTVGACLEANIAGIPGIALSQHFDEATRDAYILSYAIAQETYSRLEKQSAGILDEIFALFLDSSKKLLEKPITWNVNFPFINNSELKYMICPAGQSFYGSCFAKRELLKNPEAAGVLGRFEHELTEVWTDTSPLSDARALFDGHVTITPIDLRTFAQTSARESSDMQQIFSSIRP